MITVKSATTKRQEQKQNKQMYVKKNGNLTHAETHARIKANTHAHHLGCVRGVTKELMLLLGGIVMNNNKHFGSEIAMQPG